MVIAKRMASRLFHPIPRLNSGGYDELSFIPIDAVSPLKHESDRREL